MYRDAAGAWAALTRDPVAILLPAAGALAVDVALGLVLREAFVRDVLPPALLACAAARPLLQAPFRASMIAHGAGALPEGRVGAAGPLATLRLALVDAFRALAAVVLGALLFAPFAVLAVWLAARGLYLFASLAAGLAGLVGTATALFVRTVLAYAPIEVIAGRRSAFDALRAVSSWADWPPLALILLGGDVAVGLGGALCGAGALPGYPMADLAVLHRWSRRPS